MNWSKTAGAIAGGMGAMALLNEEEGGTFTSYPEPSRLKQLMGQDINRKEAIEALGQEIKDWGERPWDPENDKAYIDATMKKMHDLIKNDLDTWWVPRSVARKKATDYVLGFLRMASEKEGAPEMLSVKDEKVIYGAVGASPPPNPFTKDLPEGDTLRPGDFK
jgi:hypothetical protein